jgi:hypothetical protein
MGKEDKEGKRGKCEKIREEGGGRRKRRAAAIPKHLICLCHMLTCPSTGNLHLNILVKPNKHHSYVRYIFLMKISTKRGVQLCIILSFPYWEKIIE